VNESGLSYHMNNFGSCQRNQRHASGDWGDLSEEDKKENEFSLVHSLRLLSSSTLSSGTEIWVVTEGDRSSTTLLLPKEY
jgi:hypothetical protein